MSEEPKLAVSFGGGTNSTAMLCGFRERGLRPDVILFADTGNEKPHTYEHVAFMSAQVQAWWGVPLETVFPTRKGEPITLEQDCLNKGLLPSLAYGRRSCSQRFKHEPLEKRLVKWAREHKVSEITKAIGYGYDEMGRGRTAPEMSALAVGISEKFWYPLREWRWGRAECVAAIARHGLPQPGKSACWFCPASKKSEVIWLRDTHPSLYAAAVHMEDTARDGKHGLDTVKGLGRNFAWKDLAHVTEVEDGPEQLRP